MSSGERFLPKKTERSSSGASRHDFQEITINRQTIVDTMAAWLYATRMIKDANNITNIQFSDLFGASDTELVTLKVFTGGATN